MILESNQAAEFLLYISVRLIIRASSTGLFFETVSDRIYYLLNNKEETIVEILIIVAIDHLLESV